MNGNTSVASISSFVNLNIQYPTRNIQFPSLRILRDTQNKESRRFYIRHLEGKDIYQEIFLLAMKCDLDFINSYISILGLSAKASRAFSRKKAGFSHP